MFKLCMELVGFWYLLLLANVGLSLVLPYVAPFWVLTGIYWFIVLFVVVVMWLAGKKEDQLVKEEQER